MTRTDMNLRVSHSKRVRSPEALESRGGRKIEGVHGGEEVS